MQRLPNAIQSTALGAGSTDIYTAGAGITATISNLSLTNTTTSPITINLFRVPSGGSADLTNIFLNGYTLASRQTLVPPAAIGLTLTPGMMLIGQSSSAGAVLAAGSVYETSGS